MYRQFLPLILVFFSCLMLPLSGFSQPRGATILDNRDQIRLTSMSALNSPARETNLSITPDGQAIYFMSLRGGQQWSKSYMIYRGDSVYDGDIWYAEKRNGVWQRAKCMPYGINSASGEDEPVISASGKTVYFQSWNHLWEWNGGPYYKARREGTNWSRPEGLGGGITEFFKTIRATDGMTLSADEKTFIVAAGADYDGNMDLYISRYTTYGWSFCRKLGISSSGDERSAFLAADGKTLYFASDGYKGFGGLDIFKTTLNPDGSFGEVINLGKPFNTEKDDYGFIITANGNEAYFVRDGDIFFADVREADDRLKPTLPTASLTLRGTVRDSASLAAISAKVLVFDNRTQRIIKAMDCPATGKFSMEVPNKNASYDLVVSAPGYKGVRKTVNISTQSRDFTANVNVLLGKPGQPEPALAQTTPAPKPEIKPVTPTVKPVTPVSPPLVQTPNPQVKPRQAPTVAVKDPYSFEDVAKNNLTIVIDVSASMRKPEKLELMKDGLVKLLGYMRAEDRITVIAFAGELQILVNNVSAVHKADITQAIENVKSSGSTNGQAAVKRAYKLAEEHLIPGGNNRIILATDGSFDLKQVENIIDRNRKDGIVMSVFAFGKLPESLLKEMQSLAKAGGGNFAAVNEVTIDSALLKEAQAVRK